MYFLYKPRSVRHLAQEAKIGGNHLSPSKNYSPPWLVHFRHEAPLPKFGLPARRVYRVPLVQFPILLRHCGTFQDYSSIAINLSSFICRHHKMVPCLIFSASTITTGISACASLDFPQPVKKQTAITRRYTFLFN